MQLAVHTQVLPPVLSTNHKSQQVKGEQRDVKPTRHEHRLGQKPEVNSPLEEEDPAKVESTDDVLDWELYEERGSDDQLGGGTDGELHHGGGEAQHSQVIQQDRGGVQQDVHLDRHSQAEHETAQARKTVHEQVDSSVQQQHRHRVVEKAKDENGVNPVACEAHEDEDVWRDEVCADEYPEDEGQVGQVQPREDVLGQQDVCAMTSDVVETHV